MQTMKEYNVADHSMADSMTARMALRGLSLLLAAGLLLLSGTVRPIPARAAETGTPGATDPAAGQATVQAAAPLPAEASYAAYLAGFVGWDRPEPILRFGPESAVAPVDIVEADGRTGVLLEGEAECTFRIDVPEDGLYRIRLEYRSLGTGVREFELGVDLDGAVPFREAGRMRLRKVFADQVQAGGRFATDRNGNELTPRQEEVLRWLSEDLRDPEGFEADPFLFAFPAGRHAIRLSFASAGLVLAGLSLVNEPEPPAYADYLAAARTEGAEAIRGDRSGVLRVEGELPAWKTDSMLHPTSDRGNPAASPADPSHVVLNTVGRNAWWRNGQAIAWEVRVPKTGLYRLDLRVRQDLLRGLSVGRTLRIDGEIPFAEAKAIPFDFDGDWQLRSPGGSDPYLFYLEAGTRVISLEAVLLHPGLSRDMERTVQDMNALYRRILMVTGVSPDLYRDYQLEIAVPGLLDDLSAILGRLRSLRETMRAEGFRTGSEAVVVDRLEVRLSAFLEKPQTIPEGLSSLKDGVSTLSALALRLKEQHLELDFLEIAPADAPRAPDSVGFFQRILFGIRSYLASYTNQYGRFDNAFSEEEAVDVWISAGRDQAQVIKWLVDDYFIPESGIPVNINLVQGASPGGQPSQALISATITGRGPDVAIFAQPVEIMNLAVRGTLRDLSAFPGFDDLRSRHQSHSFVPYTYMDRVYALPVAEDFQMMFYRTDIFAELGLEPPDTWDDFYRLVPILQKKNLQAGLSGVDDNGFKIFLFQRGGNYYQDGWARSGFSDPEAIRAFKEWTELYTKYTLPVEFDFYSRFRTGELALGIVPYTVYNQLTVAAPEIRGLWSMRPVPGTRLPDGSVSRSVAGFGSGIILFDKAANPEGAFEFMTWFTSEETAYRYATQIEMLMGPAGRFPTANVAAMQRLPWGNREREMLLAQWDQVDFVELTPVTYYMTRNVMNAFRRVVYRGANVRETLNYYDREIQMEIDRKRRQFGLE